jgi:hypothetical protein
MITWQKWGRMGAPSMLVGSMVVATVLALVTALAWGLDHNHARLAFQQ